MIPLRRLPSFEPGDIAGGAPGHVDLFVLSCADFVAADHAALLSPDEIARRDRLRFERDRDLFTATRALARTSLAYYTHLEPAALRFRVDDYGRPHLVDGAPLVFNLANTEGLVVCAVSRSLAALGVDAEWLAGDRDPLTLVDDVFSASESRALRALPPSLQRNRFFDLWTLKESYLKARGLGLSLPLAAFSFTLGDEPRVTFDGIDDDPAAWRFLSIDAGEHRIALAAKTHGAPLTARAARWVPARPAATTSRTPV